METLEIFRRTAWICILPALLSGCAGGGTATPSPTQASVESRLDEPTRMIRRGDLVKITLKLPGSTFGSLEAVQKNGELATPDGSYVKAADMSLAAFGDQIAEHYANIPGYEAARVDVLISSSPYSIVKMAPRAPTPTTNINASASAPSVAPTIYPRNFKTPTTVWHAIQLDGGLPREVDSKNVRILKATTARKTLNCRGLNGEPDGMTVLESGDYIFLVPDSIPVSRIFD